MNDAAQARIEQVRRLIAGARAPTSFSGAGLSAESGISTFRGQDENAHWHRHDPMQLASQQGFAQNPALVTSWYASRRQTLACAVPNAGHHALACDERWRHVTQNVDDLLERAGIAPERVCAYQRNRRGPITAPTATTTQTPTEYQIPKNAGSSSVQCKA